MDIIGPILSTPIGGFSYRHKLCCQLTRVKAAYFTRSKGETTQIRISVMEDLATPYSQKIPPLRTDRGGEYIGHDFERCCEEFCIRHNFSAPYTPSQVGQCVRDGRAIMTTTRCLLNEARLHHCSWTEIATTAVYFLNRISNSTIETETLIYRVFGKDSSLAHLRTIGARAFVHQQQFIVKLMKKAWKERLVGYNQERPTYRIFDLLTRNVILSRNLTSIESPSRTPDSSLSLHDQEDIRIPDHQAWLEDKVDRCDGN